MAERIWKYSVAITDNQDVEIPKGAKLLAAGNQNGDVTHLQIWALVRPDAKRVKRQIVIHGTGHPTLMRKDQYVDTVVDFGGQLVWHVFDGGERDA